MTGVLSGFGTIVIVIAAGFLLAHLRVFDERAQVVLSRLTFYIGSPALMVTVLGSADVHRLFSTNLIASVAGVAVTALLQVFMARAVFRRDGGDTVIGTFCSSYVNAGNLGLPIAAYAIGDTSVIAPMLLVQLVALQPVGLAVLDTMAARERGEQSRRKIILTALTRPVRNPITIGSLVGVVLAVTGWHLPALVEGPVEMIGGVAVPAMLIAYGISLRTGPLPGRGENPVQLGVIVVLKLVLQPVVAWLVGAYALGLTGTPLMAVVIIAALPTAQNVFVFAVRYNKGLVLARDSVFLTTVLSVPVIIGITALLG